MPNFFTENSDLLFHFKKLDLREIVDILEENFSNPEKLNYAPVNLEDALENYYKVLEIVGDIAGNFIAPRAHDVDNDGAHFENGKVHYAKGTRENLDRLAEAGLAGMIIHRKYGGLQFPFSVYVASIEMISRADASLMNIYGLQDIGDCIHKFAADDLKEKYLHKFSTGEYTGAMALTEPDAGSDLQAVKLQAYQNEKGEWFLKGVKRFITNGNGEVLLVLARSEAGTKDARGLSMFACLADKTVVVRRIEHKLGIHGSPTCELQFNDTPAQLVGMRRFGLIKYVLDLMYRARMGVSAQAVGISQAAFDEAHKYAKEREQFGKPIFNIPVIANMLIDMRVMLEANRTLLYETTLWVDRKEQTEVLIERKKANGESFAEVNASLKQIVKVANLLTPLTKYFTTEGANKITYDALQIHGGTGYMREFTVERLARDARITNIYEGTSQMQIVAASGGAIGDVLADFFSRLEAKEFKGGLSRLSLILKEIRSLFLDALKYVLDKKDTVFQETASKDLVELYGSCFVGYLLLLDAEHDDRKVFIANRYIISALSNARKNVENIKNELFSDILHVERILD